MDIKESCKFYEFARTVLYGVTMRDSYEISRVFIVNSMTVLKIIG